MSRQHSGVVLVILVCYFVLISQIRCLSNKMSDQSCDKCACCQEEVNCSNGGQCGGLCKDGYFGKKCLNECPLNCTLCDDPYNPTDNKSLWGVANCTECKDGYYSTQQLFQCQLSCPEGCHNCTSDTHCYSCINGYSMINNSCIKCGKGCARCSSNDDCIQCKDGYYRESNDSCSLCTPGCASCTSSKDCSQCLDGFYGNNGINCTNCSVGCTNRQCNNTSGICNCTARFVGDTCNTCIDGKYGFNCNKNCTPGCKTCRRWSNDTCTTCLEGYFIMQGKCICNVSCSKCNSDKNCSECDQGHYLSSQNNRIYCSICSRGCYDVCDISTGNCNCSVGFDGQNCDRCEKGKYGTYCNLSCSDGCLNGICDRDSGKCSQCLINFKGHKCNQCKAGSFGEHCDRNCSSTCSDNECDRDYGHCTYGCIGNFSGNTCDKCVGGKYGSTCSLDCPNNCAGNVCNRNGTCDKCVDGKYGSKCSKNCHKNCAENVCNRFNGTCDGCIENFAGDTCDNCTNGFYGPNCTLNCPNNCINNACDRVDGKCNNCVDSFFGDSCDNNCSSYCSNGTCVQKTGVCTNGCVSEYSGDRCCLESQGCRECLTPSVCSTCIEGKYGIECKDNCSVNCLDNLCFKSNGTCMKCMSGFEGENCTVKLWVAYQEKAIGDVPVVLIGGGAAGALCVMIGVAVMIAVIRRRSTSRGTPKEDKVVFVNRGLYVNCGEFIALDGNSDIEIESQDEAVPPTQDNAPILEQPEAPPADEEDPIDVPQVATVESADEIPVAHYMNDTDITTIAVDNIASFVENRQAAFFNTEFHKLPKGLLKPHDEALKPANFKKNRYTGVYPYDETRVKLLAPGSDFINASYIDGFHKRREYIASLGPIAKATEGFSTFWRMVWQEKSDKIVMVTNLKEVVGMKCEQYWPDVSKTQQYGDVRVTCHSEDVYAEYTVRSFTLKRGKEQRSLHHIHFTAWPDKGTPDDVTSMVEFLNKVNSIKVTLGGPEIVHCSAGVGRTGTYIALDMLTYKGKKMGHVDIFECVYTLRQQRISMVQTVDQYEYIYRALVHTLTLGAEPIPAENFRSYLSSVSDEDMSTKYERMCHRKEKVELKEQAAIVRNSTLKSLNRRGADVPGDYYRPRVFSREAGRRDKYINAVYVSSFKVKNQFIVTQTPLPTNVNDFLTLVVQEKCSCIVSMDPPDVSDESVGCYLPADNQVLRTDSFTVHSTKLVSNNSYTLRTLTIAGHLAGRRTTRTVQHFQCTHWPEYSNKPSDTETFLQLVESVQKSAEEALSCSPVIVHCLTGAERSGLLCVVVSLLQKMEIEHEVSVINTVRQVKVRRPKAVPNKDQFLFCHECVAAYLESFDIYSNFS